MSDKGSGGGQAPANDNATAARGAAKGRCPICGKPASLEARPFCSKRCADVDLHRWLGGAYRIPVTESEELPPDRDD